MRNVFYNSDIFEAEKNIIKNIQIPSIILMENAGRNAAEFVYKYSNNESIEDIIILAGKGNNAGDAFVITRHLINRGMKVNLCLLFGENDFKGDALINYVVLKNIKSNLLSLSKIDNFKDLEKKNFRKNNLFVDAVFGIGFKGKLEKRIKDIFHYINSGDNKKIISIDTISGLDKYYDCDDCLNADVTLSMGVKKFNTLFDTGKIKSGKIETLDIGISDKEFDKFNTKKIYELEVNDFIGKIPSRSIISHKYSAGKTFIVGGSPGFTGATYLSSLSSLRIGSGAVVLGIPASLNHILETKTTEVITLPLEDTKEQTLSENAYSKISERIKWSDAILLGPGLGRNEESLSLIRNIIKQNDERFVIDADGLFAFKDKPELLKKKKNKIIITPHYGEFSNLSGLSVDEIKKDFVNISKTFAKKYNVILILKNSPTVITDGDYFYINPSGKENLATIGTGDVLAGIISGLYSQIKEPLQSALLGVYIHGKCGDEVYRKTGNSSTIAGDLIEKIPEIKMQLTI